MSVLKELFRILDGQEVIDEKKKPKKEDKKDDKKGKKDKKDK